MTKKNDGELRCVSSREVGGTDARRNHALCGEAQKVEMKLAPLMESEKSVDPCHLAQTVEGARCERGGCLQGQ